MVGMQDNDKILCLLRQETGVAMGCTEPAAVALACAHAASLLKEKVQRIELFLSPNILKNGMGVGIPGTGMTGLEIAAALGALIADPLAGLELLSAITPELLRSAKEMLSQGIVQIKLIELLPDEILGSQKDRAVDKVFIQALLFTEKDRAKALIRWKHDWLYRLELNDKVLVLHEMVAPGQASPCSCQGLTIRDYYAFCQSVDFTELNTINLGNDKNLAIAKIGLEQASGISVGRTLMEQIKTGILGDDLHHYAMALTAAATDARMSGCPLPVVSNSGSGNQGLSITLPIIAVAEKRKIEADKLLRALALGHLISIHIKERIGILSCLCGCLSASAGAASGIVYLMDGSYEQVEYAIKNMIGNTAGMVCDGAKEGCSLKVATNTSAAVQAALLAMGNLCISANDGIISKDIDATIANLAELVLSGMKHADSTILNIMINKNNRNDTAETENATPASSSTDL